MIGLILCGGKSSRMGTDKGLLKWEARTWARTSVDKMAILNIPVKLSVNNDQADEYAKVFSPGDLITDRKELPVKGPLAGVLSAHLQYPNEDIFLLGCDMLLMDPVILQELKNLSITCPAYDAWLYTNDGEPEPLCSIIKSAALKKIINMHESGQLKKHSMKFMLEHIHIFTLPLREDQKKYFRNFNTHAELNGL
ncbi:MAG: molybdenum cofactor guanylyltransferase [Bacteroidota bacterium]|nr:molybdenum cofactor guanylyltransferase [Bacteroidota bacterium]